MMYRYIKTYVGLRTAVTIKHAEKSSDGAEYGLVVRTPHGLVACSFTITRARERKRSERSDKNVLRKGR